MAALVQRLFDSSTDASTIYTALGAGAIIGVALPELSSLLSWFRLHFLSRSKLHQYRHAQPRAWALVTGASDGIGYGYVQELASQGFNVILHGRNAAKIDGLIKALKMEYPDSSFEAFICGATDRSAWKELDMFAASLEKRRIPLTVLVNNVGGNPAHTKTFDPLVDYTADDLTAVVDMNATFPVQMTRAVLPILINNKPSLVINMTSAVGTQSSTIPYLVTYSAGKAFDRQFSRVLRMEMVATGHPEVDVISVIAARVQSAGMRVPTSIFTPSSRQFAASALRLAGSGRDEVVGWWSHSLQLWSLSLLPEWVREKVMVQVGTVEKQLLESIHKKSG